MSVTGISLSSTPYVSPLQSDFNQRRTDFQALAGALQGGDLNAAQQAFAALQKDVQSVQSAAQGSGVSGQSDPITNDLQALGNALQSGDMTSAQKAFATLQQDMQSAHKAHHHHHHHGGTSSATQAAGATSITDTGGVSGTGNTVNLQA